MCRHLNRKVENDSNIDSFNLIADIEMLRENPETLHTRSL